MQQLADIAQFDANRKTVCVQGLGFVGSAMALAVAAANADDGKPLYNVIGIDIANEAGKAKAEALNCGIFPFENSDDNLSSALINVHNQGNLWCCTDNQYFQYADVVIVDINLDVHYGKDMEPFLDLSAFKGAIKSIGENISPDTLVIVETTVPPGTCEKVVLPILQQEFEKRNLDTSQIFLAHSYERVMPGKDYFDSIVNFWRVYSGIDEKSADKCEAFLKSVIKTDTYPLTRLQKTTSTEIAKVLENSYRATTIAFMEEWGRFAEAVGVDLFEVVDAIRMRPTHSNMRQPGFGVGGYCLTKDPYFAMLASKDIFEIDNLDFPFCVAAVETNRKMPLVSLDKIIEVFDGDLKGKKLLVCGVSYRQDVGDTRYSPTETFARAAMDLGADLDYWDPLVSHWDEMDVDVRADRPSDIDKYDAIVFTVQHPEYMEIDFKEWLGAGDRIVFDANRVLTDEQRATLEQLDNIKFSSIGR